MNALEKEINEMIEDINFLYPGYPNCGNAKALFALVEPYGYAIADDFPIEVDTLEDCSESLFVVIEQRNAYMKFFERLIKYILIKIEEHK